MNKYSIVQEERNEWNRFWIEKGLHSVEILLLKCSGKYCFGDQITMADCFLIPQIYNAHRFKVDMEQFPSINKVVQNLEKIEAFLTAQPEKQPDYPKS